MPGPGPRNMDNSKPKDTKAVILRLLTYVGKFKKNLFLTFFFVVLQTVCSLVASYMLRPLINKYIIPGSGLESWPASPWALALWLWFMWSRSSAVTCSHGS